MKKVIQVDVALVKHVAQLSRLTLDPSEVEPMKVFFQDMLAYMDQLNEINTDSVLPFISPTHEEALQVESFTVGHEDKPQPSLPTQKVLTNCATTAQAQFKLQAVIEDL
jgi:aspartyl/glutamyl-tRNA(Asn/Gln) amidotransferase C subunit